MTIKIFSDILKQLLTTIYKQYHTTLCKFIP